MVLMLLELCPFIPYKAAAVAQLDAHQTGDQVTALIPSGSTTFFFGD